MSDRLPVIYIAGPYRAATPWGILRNIRAAQEVALQVWKLGAVALCPHANTALFDGEAPDDLWLDGDLELLRRSDAIVMVHGWHRSTGACAERIYAIETLKLPRFEPDDWGLDYARLKEWIDGWKNDRRVEAVRYAASRDIESDFD
jgi:hypothetical protein